MRIEQYIQMMDYSLWDVTENGHTLPKTQVVEGVTTRMVILFQELKELPPHLEYAFLEGDDKLPVIIAKDLSVEEKTALITILKSHKRAIAWKLSDIKEQVHLDHLKEMDLRWKMAMLTMRARKFLKKTGRKLNINGNETIGFNKTNMESYNYHKRGHFARECRAPRSQDTKHKEITKRNVPMETPASI
nr:ribonuclease H-like domain-containing protein [Tanacetum cinerariifolium]